MAPLANIQVMKLRLPVHRYHPWYPFDNLFLCRKVTGDYQRKG
jgi:hypothetical protein